MDDEDTYVIVEALWMMEKKYVVVRDLFSYGYTTVDSLSAKSNVYSKGRIYSEPVSLEEAMALVKIMNAAEEG